MVPPKLGLVNIAIIIIALVVLLLAIAALAAGAQVEPAPTPQPTVEAYPTQYCWIDEDGKEICSSWAAMTPSPTSTPELGPPPLPSATPTATATEAIEIQPLYRVRLPLIIR
jgi:hypothetical protein